jgi:hypothetical protein
MDANKKKKQKQIYIVLPFLYAKFATPFPFERITILLSKSFFTHVL